MSRNDQGRTYRGNDESAETIDDPDFRTTSHRTPRTFRHASFPAMDVVRNNPIPLALVGIGLGWLALSGSGYDRRIARSHALDTVRHRAGDAASYARGTFYGAADGLRHAAASAYDSASDAIGDTSDAIRDRAGRLTGISEAGSRPGTGHADGPSSVGRMRHAVSDAGGRLRDVVEDHPLVAGVMGIMVGAALGAALPSTRYEDRWVGDYADEATGQAKALAKEALDRGARVTQTAVEAATEEVGNAAAAVSGAVRDEAKKPA